MKVISAGRKLPKSNNSESVKNKQTSHNFLVIPLHATGLFLYPPKTYGFVMLSGGIERDQWHEMGKLPISL